MQIPSEIVFRGVRRTEFLEDLVNSRIAKLERICDYIISCRVAVEKRQTKLEGGSPYRVRIHVKIPHGRQVIARQRSGRGDIHDPPELVIRKAFTTAERRLRQVVEQQHREIKTHPEQVRIAVVSRVFPERGYGFIRSVEDMREIYFHKNSVLHNSFDSLKVGTTVRFVDESGIKGPQASTVEIVQKALAYTT